MMTPAFAKALRKVARRDQEKLRGRLGPGRFDAILAELVAVIRLAFSAGVTSSLFGLEGPLRHAIRSDLCLRGWRWFDANVMACELMEEAFRTVRADRPSWNEGQPEWVIEAGTLIERTRCVRCHKSLPETHKKFCSDLCRTGHHLRLYRLRKADEDTAVHMATRILD